MIKKKKKEKGEWAYKEVGPMQAKLKVYQDIS